MNEETPLLAIRCAAYNQVAFIRKCLDGFAKQKTTFPFVAIVHDDASTDGTSDVIKEYAECYPKIIKAYFEVENQYSKGRLGHIMASLIPKEVKYIAICEGDDYWIDPLKLQSQVDFLERNPEYVLSHTSFIKHYPSENKYYSAKNLEKETKDIKDVSPEMILKNEYWIQTATVVIRKSAYEKVKNSDFFIYKSSYFPFGDLQTWYGLSKEGLIHYLPKITTVYNANEGSATRATNPEKKYLFDLRGLEMRLYLCKRDNLSDAYTQYLNRLYTKTYLKCSCYNENVKALYTCNTKTNKLMSILKKLGLLRLILDFLVKNRRPLGYIKRTLFAEHLEIKDFSSTI